MSCLNNFCHLITKNKNNVIFLPFKAGYLSFQIIVKDRVVVIINKNVLTEAFRSHLLGD